MQADPDRIVSLVRDWIGTPYRHQASCKGAGADCLGLVRGIWRDLHGSEPSDVPPYSRDWGEVGGREVLLAAARQFLIEVPLAEAGNGGLILFRMRLGAPAKHCGIRAGGDPPTLIHARETTGVIEEPFTTSWQRRAAFVFLFPG